MALTIDDAERAFYEEVLGNPGGLWTIQDLRLAYYLAALDGSLPGTIPSGTEDGQVPVWDEDAQKWVPGAAGGGITLPIVSPNGEVVLDLDDDGVTQTVGGAVASARMGAGETMGVDFYGFVSTQVAPGTVINRIRSSYAIVMDFGANGQAGAAIASFGAGLLVLPLFSTPVNDPTVAAIGLEGVKLPQYATVSLPDPTTHEGYIVYDSTLKKVVFSDGSTWIPV